MCAINGVINKYGRVKHPLAILDMGDVGRHRGPDFSANYLSPDGHVAINHRRLSLVGLDGRSTVMSIPRRDQPAYEIALAFNGEIYNYKELKSFFATKGYTSVSPSDFETIIFAYQEWGHNCLDHLIGEFAFVLFDDLKGEVFIARDRTGVRPLFYAFVDDEFVFSSEVKGILKYPGFNPSINKAALAEFILMSHSFAAGSLSSTDTFYKGVHQVPPAHFGILGSKCLPLTRYWQLPIHDDTQETGCFHRYERIRSSLVNSVKARIPCEVPTAFTVSGGLDSSIITALGVLQNNANITGFCVRYSGDKNEDYEYAKIFADHYGINLLGPVITPEVMIETINRAILANDGPVDSIRRLGMLLNYECIRTAGFKAALIGEGADEFNLGYYHSFPGLKKDSELCISKDSFIGALLQRAEYVREFFTDDFLSNVDFKAIASNISSFYDECLCNSPLKKMQFFYATRFLSYLQDGNDRAAMSNSVEARVPFVDPSVIEACLDIPTSDNIDDDDEKKALRLVFKDILPKAIAERQKSAFPANNDKTLYYLINKELNVCILKAPLITWSILRRDRLEALSSSFAELLDSETTKETICSWLPLSEPVSLRINHIFTFLTVIRWLDICRPRI